MNATDLRIGNKILHCDRMQTVSEIMKKNGDYCFKTEECKSLYIYYWLIHCTSIALTEEMLLKCGFEVKTENKECCGSCRLFSNEDIEGAGWCDFHQYPARCDERCEDIIAITDQEEYY
jgi:hypothetical protein